MSATYRAYPYSGRQFAALSHAERVTHAIAQAAPITATVVVNPAEQADVEGVTVTADPRVPLGVVWVAIDETGGEA